MDLRVLDLGWVSGLRSQTVWHAIAGRMGPADPPVLALMSPADRYVSIGFHRALSELDLDACARRGLRVYRRRAGGGPVLCDQDQLFFQLIAPAATLPGARTRAWTRAMSPAVEAFRTLGAPASLTDSNDIVANGRKVSGTGAARIGEAEVFVGNVILAFDHEAMADCLNLTPAAKHEAVRLMRAHLAAVSEAAGRSVTRDEAHSALVDAYTAAFGPARPGHLRPDEWEEAARLDRLFEHPAWVGAERVSGPPRVKIRAGVAIVTSGDSWFSIVDGRVERACILDGWVAAPGMRDALERALSGVPVEESAIAGAVRDAGGGDEGGRALADAIVGAYRGGA